MLGCCPNAIVTDYSKAIQGAVLDVFPGFAQGSTMQTMGSELCISDSALIEAEVEEKGNRGGPGLSKQKIDTEVEEENDDVDEEEKEDDDFDEEEEEDDDVDEEEEEDDDVDEEEEEDDDDDDENDSLKKADEKLNKESFIREIEESEYRGEYIGTGTDSDFENEDDKKAYLKYREEFLSSGGFDIENYYVPPPRKMIFGLLFRVDHLGFGKHCEEAVKNVLKFQNQKVY
ncbi:hypothetical protein Cni_G11209 [Canna indica]|uniref:Uncharacterized protein n=1 Tax=Canna indica TaxID=4628 RepID=A0AAQ3QBH1_9LILI|nr:hypothetical protein Cni_G11209 [Canna indica]